MSRRPGRMPLYEAMQTGAARGMRRLDVGAPGPGAESESSPTGFSGVMRVPAGIMMIGAAIGVLLLIAVYVVGYSRAESELQEDRDDKLLAEARSLYDPDAPFPAGTDGTIPAFPGGGRELPGGGAAEPPADGSTPDDGRSRGSGDASETPAGTEGDRDGDGGRSADGSSDRSSERAAAVDLPAVDAGEPAPALFGNRSGWGPILSDPRRAGFYYWIVAETTRPGAVRLCEFLRARGLEAYAVPGKNAFLRVAVLPGHRKRNDPQNADLVRLEESLERIGRAWQRAGGTSDLGDKYRSLQN